MGYTFGVCGDSSSRTSSQPSESKISRDRTPPRPSTLSAVLLPQRDTIVNVIGKDTVQMLKSSNVLQPDLILGLLLHVKILGVGVLGSLSTSRRSVAKRYV